MAKLAGHWQKIETVMAIRFLCGYCSTTVSSEKGWLVRLSNGQVSANLRVCPECNKPTYLDEVQVPAPRFGNPVKSLPDEVEKLYDECRSCTAASAFTPAVLAARKLLMHIAVDKGAKPGETFQSYVEYLANSGYVPPDGKVWVDHIRNKGNEANHEIRLMSQADAEDLIVFSEMLLKLVYEFPNRVPSIPVPPTGHP